MIKFIILLSYLIIVRIVYGGMKNDCHNYHHYYPQQQSLRLRQRPLRHQQQQKDALLASSCFLLTTKTKTLTNRKQKCNEKNHRNDPNERRRLKSSWIITKISNSNKNNNNNNNHYNNNHDHDRHPQQQQDHSTSTSSSTTLIQQQPEQQQRCLPSVQKVNQKRPARRLNHAFKYLYRHHSSNNSLINIKNHDDDDDDNNNNRIETEYDRIQFLMEHVGYTYNDIICLNITFPLLLKLSIQNQLYPKIQFLKYTLLYQFRNNKNNTSHNNNHTTNSIKSFLLITELLNQYRYYIPPQYYASRLETSMAPKHAFLVWYGLPCGIELFRSTIQQSTITSSSDDDVDNLKKPMILLLHEFLLSCHNTKQFVLLCHKWKRLYGMKHYYNYYNSNYYYNYNSNHDIDRRHYYCQQDMIQKNIMNTKDKLIISIRHVDAFENMFSKGIMPAIRNDIIQHNNTWSRQYIPYELLTNTDIIQLLIQHGSNVYELDYRGVSLLHWASGCNSFHHVNHDSSSDDDDDDDNSSSTVANHLIAHHIPNHNNNTNDYYQYNNLPTVQLLLEQYDIPINIRTIRDNATILHWACAGCNRHSFGIGGNIQIVQYILKQFIYQNNRNSNDHNNNIILEDYINVQTNDGNTALMWAVWSGSYDIVIYLLENYKSIIDMSIVNHNGCTLAHWATSGGSLQICQYLYDQHHISFNIKNYANNTPLSHAIAFNRYDIVQWLLQLQQQEEKENHHHQQQQEELSHVYRMSEYEQAKHFVNWTNDPQRKEFFQLFEKATKKTQ